MKRKLITLAIASLVSNLSIAQNFALEEVIVTAQKRAQNLQDVPISMSVVSSEDLDNNSILNFYETEQLTPGVSLNAINPISASIKIRGVGPSELAASTAQSVAIFVDEVSASQPGAVFATLVDVERLEVLRGPQGTLYGKNAPSGAYNITTRAPSFEGVEGYIEGTLSQWDNTDEVGKDLRGAINIPLANDTLAMRLAAVYAENDGGIEMASPLATDDTSGGKEHIALRSRFLLSLDSRSDLQLIANYQDLEDSYGYRNYDGQVPGTGEGQVIPALYNDFDNRRDYGNFASTTQTDTWDTTLKYAWEGDAVFIDAILNYSEFESDLHQNQTPYPTESPGTVTTSIDTEQVSFELRASGSTELMDYVAGLYWTDRSGGATTDIDLGTVVIPSDLDRSGDSASIFGNTTIHLSEQWDVGLGLRYEDAEQDQDSVATILGFGNRNKATASFSHLSWSFKVNYFPSDTFSPYLAIDNTFRQGGIGTYPPAIAALGDVLGNNAISETARAYSETDEETSTAFEIGAKGTALDDRLRYSVALFYQEFDDHILASPIPNHPDLDLIADLYSLVPVNADEVVTQGVEWELTYLLAQDWTVDFRGAYSDATIEDWDEKLCSNEFQDPVGELYCAADSGQELTALPKWNLNTQITYTREVIDNWLLTSNLAWTWKSESGMDLDDNRFNDPLNFLNLNFAVSDEAWTFKLWGKNLTDEDSNQQALVTTAPLAEGAAGYQGGYTPGREYGVSLGYQF